MADKTFPIGSIIKTGEHLGIITGITFDEIDKLVEVLSNSEDIFKVVL